jgi:hypothetical protein
LFIPRIHTSSKPTGCSGFNNLRWVLEELGRQKRTVTTVWMPKGIDVSGLPTGECGMEYVFGSHTWKQSIRCDTVETDDALIEAFHSKKIVADVVLTDYHFTQPYHSVIQYETQFGMNIPETVPIVTWFNETPWQESLHYFKRPAAIPLLGLAALAGELTYVSNFVKKDFVDRSRRYFSATVLKRIADGRVITPCIDSGSTDFDAIYAKNEERRKSRDRVLVFNAGAPSARRRFDVMVNAVDKARRAGRDNLFVRFCTQLDAAPDFFSKPFCEVRTQVRRPDLVSVLHEADIVYEGNTFEGTALFLWESILAGSMPVFFHDAKCSDWLDGRVPKSYPFFAKTEDELASMFAYLAQNIDAENVRSARAELRAFVAKEVDQLRKADTWATTFRDVITGEVRADRYRKGAMSEMMVAARQAYEGRPLSTKELGKLAKANSRTQSVDPCQLLSNAAFRRLAQFSGFRDVGTPQEERWEVGWEEWVPESIRS